jgi:hypothetical protein
MKELDHARQLHGQLDTIYAARLFRATVLNQTKAIQKNAEYRRINDGAYFLMIFGTFERYVTNRADVAVRIRANKLLYHHRRAWETLLKGSRLSATFLNRVRVLLDQRSPHFVKIQGYYTVRNELAHSGLTQIVFSIPTLVSDLKSADKNMKH